MHTGRSVRGIGCVGACLLACGGELVDSGSGAGGNGGGALGGGGATPDPITLLPDGWNQIAPGGDTRCGDGSAWSFYVRKGSTNRLVLDLQGGGACFDETTCFSEHRAVTHLRIEPDLEVDAPAGLHDRERADNPFADWHYVIVSYCTGDQHWGNRDAQYGAHTFYHRGAVNMRAVLAWAAENVPAPEAVFVTGSSAGSHGSIMWAPWVARQYPGARVFQLGDGAMGTVPAGIVPLLRARWNADDALPMFIEGADPDAIQTLPDLYGLVARGFPEMPLAEVNSGFDLDLSGWWELLSGGDARSFYAELRKNLAAASAAAPRFRWFLYPGSSHTLTSKPETYTVDANGTRFRDWLAAMAAGEAVDSVDCAPDCGGPWVGDLGAPEEWACLAESTPSTPPAPTFELGLRLLRGPSALGSIDVAAHLGSAHVRACSRDDAACDAPVAEGDASAYGEIILTLPAGTSGFDGTFRIESPETLPSRIAFWPPLTSGGDWFLSGHGISLEPPDSAETIAAKVGKAFDPNLGQLRVGLLDCARSYTASASVTLDDAAPDGFITGPPVWVESARSPRPVFVNVAPGVHTLTYRADASDEVEATMKS